MRSAAEPASSHQHSHFVPLDSEEALLCEVMRRSLTTAELDTRSLQRKNMTALLLGLEAFERLAREEFSTAKVARHASKQAGAIRHLSGYFSLASKSGTTNTDKDNDDPLATGAYTE